MVSVNGVQRFSLLAVVRDIFSPFRGGISVAHGVSRGNKPGIKR
jgi:hypothetical protein